MTIRQALVHSGTGSAVDGGLTVTGGGMLTLSASNTYTGGTWVSGGTLQLANAAALGTGGLTANAGVVDLNGFSTTVSGLSGLAGTITDNATNSQTTTLTVNQSTATTFSGEIADGPSDRVALVMAGPGTLVLSGTGPTRRDVLRCGHAGGGRSQRVARRRDADGGGRRDVHLRSDGGRGADGRRAGDCCGGSVGGPGAGDHAAVAGRSLRRGSLSPRATNEFRTWGLNVRTESSQRWVPSTNCPAVVAGLPELGSRHGSRYWMRYKLSLLQACSPSMKAKG